MALPPVVIIDRLQPDQMLGVSSWTKHRPEALSFPSPTIAEDWIASQRKVAPAMFKGRDAAPDERPQKLLDEGDGGVRRMQDYDPLLGSA